MELTATLVADVVETITKEVLARYILDAVRMHIDTSAYAEGPVDGNYVVGRELDREKFDSPRELFEPPQTADSQALAARMGELFAVRGPLARSRW